MKLALPLGGVSFLHFLLAVGFSVLSVHFRAAAIAPENVLVLYNGDQGPDGDGFQIANYYQQVRPGVHVVPISGIDAILTGADSEKGVRLSRCNPPSNS